MGSGILEALLLTESLFREGKFDYFEERRLYF
jgi:hypothetical protein